MAPGQNHTCALSRGRDVYCWGHGTQGQLGNSATANAAAPVEVLLGTAG